MKSYQLLLLLKLQLMEQFDLNGWIRCLKRLFQTHYMSCPHHYDTSHLIIFLYLITNITCHF